MTVPHYFTFLRLVLIPLFIFFYRHGQLFGMSAAAVPIALLVTLALSELSDACDGFLARKLNQVTDFGKIFDPMADSLSRLAVYFCFTQGSVALPLEIPFLMLYRDMAVSLLRTVCALKGVAFSARSSGKFKAFIQASCAFAILLGLELVELKLLDLSLFRTVAFYLGILACGFSLFSGFEYYYASRHYLKNILVGKL